MAGDTIRVRMYAVGFGDCFLVGFPGPTREHFVLIDCGVHNATKKGRRADIATEVIPDILAVVKKATGSERIDVVVATHHHLDHVSGFRFEGWADVDVGEVWLPWTEDPSDPDAQRIRKAQSTQAKFLLALDADKDPKWEAVRAISENNVGFTNAAAMSTLQAGFAGSPRRYYLPQPAGKARSRRFSSKVVPGLEVTILGPSRDESAIRDMTPPSEESYFRFGDDRTLGVEGEPLPFEPFFIARADYAKDHQELLPNHGSDLGNVAKAGRIDALGLAVALEQATNGTSLVLALRFGDTTMLFPGDAQWGTWDRMLHDPASMEILRSINLYKVGHHGSHNATPVSFVSKVLHDADAAMVSVAPTTIPSWKDIPRIPLLNALATKTAIVLDSDANRQAVIENAALPTNAAVKVGPGGLWTEIHLPVERP